MELNDLRNAERKVLKETRKSQTLSFSEIWQMAADGTDATSFNLEISYLEASHRVYNNMVNNGHIS